MALTQTFDKKAKKNNLEESLSLYFCCIFFNSIILEYGRDSMVWLPKAVVYKLLFW